MIVNIGKMGTITTISRQYIHEDSEEFTHYPIDDEGRKYQDVHKTTCFNQPFYVNTDHIVSLESVEKYDIKCTEIVLSTGEKFITRNSLPFCLITMKVIQL
jgi:hypothetical protein